MTKYENGATIIDMRILAILLLAACGSAPLASDDLAPRPDLARPARDLGWEPRPDLAVGQLDFGVDPDMALSPDLASAVDMATAADMTLPADMAPVVDMVPAADLAPMCPSVPACPSGPPCCNGASCIDGYCWNAPGSPCNLNPANGPVVGCWQGRQCGVDGKCK